MSESGQVTSVDDIAHDKQKLEEKARQLVRSLSILL